MNVMGVRRSEERWLTASLGIIAGAGALATLTIASAGPPGQTQLDTDPTDFFHHGTQPNTLNDPFLSPSNCANCHGYYNDFQPDDGTEPWDTWVHSMMGQAARDPVWRAAVAIANQDANVSGEFCIRCHAPNAWLNGRSSGGDPGALLLADLEGVFCHFCHRAVDPIADPENPIEDVDILVDLVNAGLLPSSAGNAQYVIDPDDSRRGPHDDVPENMHSPLADILVSPFHQDSLQCGTCHDVSNPAFTRQPDGTYVLNDTHAPHPSGDPHEMFPEQRTYSEWLMSQFANGGVMFNDGRFGGNHINNPEYILAGTAGLMQSCQDCHMPDQNVGGCFAWENPPFFRRPDMPLHTFAGANTWVLDAIYDIYGSASGMWPAGIAEAKARNVAMLQAASDTEARQLGDTLEVRVINYSGHKLPTGYPEGRRVWVNVRFFDELDALVGEHGAYDDANAILDTASTKVYESVQVVGADAAAASGIPQGTHGHLVLASQIDKDNRIPPIGFTNAGFASVRAEPIAATYADGQYWDDTSFPVPIGASRAEVRIFYQTTSREYIDHLKDANVTNSDGDTAHAMWVLYGKSAPVEMDFVDVPLTASNLGDVNNDGSVNVLDLLAMLGLWGPCPPPSLCQGDLNGDGAVNVLDLLILLTNWG